MRLIFSDFSTREGLDFLEAGNGQDPNDRDSVVVRASGSTIPSNFDSMSTGLWVVFTSGEETGDFTARALSFTARGFSIKIMDEALACKYNLSWDSHFFLIGQILGSLDAG